MARVAIIGAGVSGLQCAQHLLSLAAGRVGRVTVFEWGRGPGGRMARRRVKLSDGTDISFDHAAPFFTGVSPEFRAILGQWEAAGHAARWKEAGESIWVGSPTNHAICRSMADGLESSGEASMLYGRHVRSAHHDAASGEWVVHAVNRAVGADEEYRFDAVVFSDKLLLLPNPYAVLPAAEWGPLALPPALASTGAVVLMLALEGTGGAPSSPLITSSAHAPLKMLVRDSAKPRRQTGGGRELDLWVAHSTAEYAAAHLAGDDPPGIDDEGAVLAEMRAAVLATLAEDRGEQLCTVAGEGATAGSPVTREQPKVAYEQVFMWDHAQPSAGSRVPQTHLLDAPRLAGVCGDFFAGPGGHEGVEAAVLSGLALAEALLPLLKRSSM